MTVPYTVATSATASADSIACQFYVHVETLQEKLLRISNTHANMAFCQGLLGDESHAILHAELADCYAALLVGVVTTETLEAAIPQ